MSNTGMMTLKTQSAVALWNEEITGQLSDGMWENASPWEHWKFWNKLVCSVGTMNVVTSSVLYQCKKNSYRLSALYAIVGDRMVATGRMGQFTLDHNALSAAQDMPSTLEEFLQRKTSGKWKYDYVAKYMESVDEDLAKKYYASAYDVKSLKKDIASIKEAMKSVKL